MHGLTSHTVVYLISLGCWYQRASVLPLETSNTEHSVCISTWYASDFKDYWLLNYHGFLYSIVPVIVAILKQVRRWYKTEYTTWLILHVQSHATMQSNATRWSSVSLYFPSASLSHFVQWSIPQAIAFIMKNVNPTSEVVPKGVTEYFMWW